MEPLEFEVSLPQGNGVVEGNLLVPDGYETLAQVFVQSGDHVLVEFFQKERVHRDQPFGHVGGDRLHALSLESALRHSVILFLPECLDGLFEEFLFFPYAFQVLSESAFVGVRLHGL